MTEYYKEVKGTYRNKPIVARVLDNVVVRFRYVGGSDWYFPPIEDGRNVDEHLFELEELHENI